MEKKAIKLAMFDSQQQQQRTALTTKTRKRNIQVVYVIRQITHWSTPDSNLDVVEHVILPHAEKDGQRKETNVSQPAINFCFSLIIGKCKQLLQSAVEEKFKGKVKLRYLPPNMTHKPQPLDVSINATLKTKTKAVYSFEYDKETVDLISQSTKDETWLSRLSR